jgi:hypothetical protein
VTFAIVEEDLVILSGERNVQSGKDILISVVVDVSERKKSGLDLAQSRLVTGIRKVPLRLFRNTKCSNGIPFCGLGNRLCITMSS